MLTTGNIKRNLILHHLELIVGALPNTALYLAKQWATLHKTELQKMWENQEFKEIKPLD
jgi:hypothetical protein